MWIRYSDLCQAIRGLFLPSLLITIVLTAVGCDLPTAPDASIAEGQPPAPIATPENEADSEGDATGSGGAQSGGDATAGGGASGTADAGDGDASDAGDGGGKVVEARPFAGKVKRNRPGLYTTPINAYFSSQQRIAFIQIEDGLKKFNFTEGRKPKDFDEVMKKVIKPRGLSLPELEAGDKYIFDPTKGQYGEVMIQKAAKE